MRKTFFPSALFGLCSTSLLLLGLSSLRTDPRIFAQSQNSVHSPQPSRLSADEVRLTPDQPDWSSDGGLTFSENEYASADFGIDMDAWDTGPAPGDPFAYDPKGGYLGSRDSSTYRYYYRFIAEDAWSEDSSTAMDADGSDEPWLWLDDEPEGPNHSMSQTEYSFIDEYSSEEAARYEMAQEGDGQNDSVLAETDDYSPWYEKYYYFIDPQSEVARPNSRCCVVSSVEESANQAEDNAVMTVAELEALVRREHAESFYQPDYEADVAAGWLFGTRGEDDHDLAFLPAGPDEIAVFDLSNNDNDEAQDEAYEDWNLFEDDVLSGFSLEDNADISDDTTDSSSENAGIETSSEDWQLNPDSASNSLEDNENYETWIIVNHDPLVGNSGDDENVSPPEPTDTPWHGEPGEDFAWPEVSDVNESDPILLNPSNQSTPESGLMDGNDEDQFEWIDPYDDRYYDESFNEPANESGAAVEEEFQEPMTSWTEEDPSQSNWGEAWDYERSGYSPSEMAPPVAGFPEAPAYRDEDFSPEGFEDFETYDEESISLRRMGSAILDLIPQFPLWK